MNVPKHLFNNDGRLVIDPNIAVRNGTKDRSIRVTLELTDEGHLTVVVTKSEDGRPS